MAVRHGADPYVVGPDAFPHDPLASSLAPGWHAARSVYGPVFTWFSMVEAALFGPSALAARLWFQGAAGVALVGSARRLQREVGSGAAAVVGLSPVLIAAVNGGHNDLLVGWLVLLALGRSQRHRGALLGAATAVKLSALPLVLAVGLAEAGRRRWRSLWVGLGAWAAVLAGTYAAGGGAHLLEPVGAVGARTSRASAWAVVERVVGSTSVGAAVVGAAGAIAALVIVGVAWRWRSSPMAAAVTAAGAAACFAAPYVLVWYPATILPVSGRAIGSKAAVILQVGSSALLLAYVVPAGAPSGAVPGAGIAAVGCGLVLGALVVVLLARPNAASTAGRSPSA